MEIFILRDAQQTGPFSEDQIRQMLDQGAVSPDDLAFQQGMSEWAPLQTLLQAGHATAEPHASSHSAEPATPKQKVFLQYLGISVSETLTKEEAAVLVNDAMEDPKHAARVAKWNTERLTLHPDLFAEELQAYKEQRIQRYFEVCHAEGAEMFEGITKAHCQVLVGYLDVKFPNWDANPAEAAQNYFFPAVAEKFPQLVRPEWKGKIKAPKAPKVAPEVKRKAAAGKPAVSPTRKKSSPFGSLVKGFILGLLLVGATGGGLYLYNNPSAREELLAKAKTPASEKPVEKAADAPVGEEKAAEPPPAPTKEEPAAPVEAPVQPEAKMAAAEPAPAPATPAPAPAATEPAPAMADAPTMSEAPSMAAAPAPATVPESEPAAAAPMGGIELFDPNPAPAKPAEGAMEPGTSTSSPAEPLATLTKNIEVQTQFGVLKIPARTKLPIVERDGLTLRVRFQNQVIPVQVADTDLAAESLF